MQAKNIAGVILAGGQGRRLGGVDKACSLLGGRPLVEHVIDRALPQVNGLIINAGGEPARFKDYGLPVVADTVEGFAGPLAGILTALEWFSKNSDAAWLASFAVDTPFLPLDLVARLAAAATRQKADIACARSGDRAHPVFALWPVRLTGDLRHALVEQDIHKIDRWTSRHKVVHVDFAPITGGGLEYDQFFNVNRPEDLTEAGRIARSAT